MDYPGHIVKVGESDRALVDAITKQLATLGYKLDKPSDGYDAALASLVKLFQSQHFDAGGRPLQADGQIGPISWGALFGAAPVTVTPKGIAGAALASLASPALADALIDNVNGLALDQDGKVIHFSGLLITPDGHVVMHDRHDRHRSM